MNEHAVRAVIEGKCPARLVRGAVVRRGDQRIAIFPGSFHPLHGGHREMAAFAERRLGVPVEYEISWRNVDKPDLSAEEVARRLAQFATTDAVWLTTAPQFRDKARLFHRATFFVGADTMLRIADLRYYDQDADTRRAALATFDEQDIRFLVFGRQIRGRFQTLSQLTLPDELRPRCDEVSPQQFRRDISSTALRQADAGE